VSSVYIVLDGSRVVGVSARLQGAELIRITEARRLAAVNGHTPTSCKDCETEVYTRLRIENHNVQDED